MRNTNQRTVVMTPERADAHNRRRRLVFQSIEPCRGVRIIAGFDDLQGDTATLYVDEANSIEVTPVRTMTGLYQCITGTAIFICAPPDTMLGEPLYIVGMNNQARDLLDKRHREWIDSFTPIAATTLESSSWRGA